MAAFETHSQSPDSKRLILIGYRGTGKSSTAGVLAERMGWKAIDADQQLQITVGRPIAEIFREFGEPAFRQLEAHVLRSLLDQDQIVVATGGGAILDASNRQLMANAGTVIWLKARVTTIQERLRTDPASAGTRPALLGQDPIQEVASVLELREPLYAEIAHHAVSTDDLKPADVATLILEWLQRERPGRFGPAAT